MVTMKSTRGKDSVRVVELQHASCVASATVVHGSPSGSSVARQEWICATRGGRGSNGSSDKEGAWGWRSPWLCARLVDIQGDDNCVMMGVVVQ